jgi:hypothetical protein
MSLIPALSATNVEKVYQRHRTQALADVFLEIAPHRVIA